MSDEIGKPDTYHILQLPDTAELKIPDSERETYRLYTLGDVTSKRQMLLNALRRLELLAVKAAVVTDNTLADWHLYFPNERIFGERIEPERWPAGIGVPEEVLVQLPRYAEYFDYRALRWFSRGEVVHAVLIGWDVFDSFPRTHLAGFTRNVLRRPTDTKTMLKIVRARGWHCINRKRLLAEDDRWRSLL